MKFALSQSFYFESAHTLQRSVQTEESMRIHGHTYSAEVTIVGERDPQTGMVVDLAHLRAAIEEVRKRLDHRLLDEVEGLGAPTLENLCEYLWRHIAKEIPAVARVRVARGASGDSCALEQGPR